jgi:hypothetical protein
VTDDPPERWVVVLTPEPGAVPPAVRVRQVLKYALRRQGLKCAAVLADVPADVCEVELVEENGV